MKKKLVKFKFSICGYWCYSVVLVVAVTCCLWLVVVSEDTAEWWYTAWFGQRCRFL